MSLSLSTITFVVGLVLTAGFLLYRAILPKPIPGIPYHEPSAKRLLGDIPDAIKASRATGEISKFLRDRSEQLQSPVVQVFLRPFSKPSVIVADAREALDIMARRSREFDRASFLANIFRAAVPYHQVVLPTGPQWRYNRRIVADTMTPQFLHHVASHKVHEQTLALIGHWQQKARLARGRAFDVTHDMQNCTVDTIWAAAFGTDLAASRTQRDFLATRSAVPLPTDVDALATLPTTAAPPEFTALTTVAASSEIALHSPFGWLHHWVALRTAPRLRKAYATMHALVDAQVQGAWEKFGREASGVENEGEGEGEGAIKSAVDLVVAREVALARKENRRPLHDSVYIKYELGGFLIAGYETTSTTVSWGLKYLTARQDVQTRLREALHAALPELRARGRKAGAEELAKLNVPYLDAFIEENLRVGCIVPGNTRVATVDTHILGHAIPKGADIILLNNGASVQYKPMLIDENKRSQSSRDAKESTARWDQDDLDVFNPDRWLVKQEDGTFQYDARAAPQQSMGAGPRSCFGRRLAYLEMRTIFSLIVLNFKLLPIPENLVDFQGVDEVTHHPKNVRIRLAESQ